MDKMKSRTPAPQQPQQQQQGKQGKRGNRGKRGKRGKQGKQNHLAIKMPSCSSHPPWTFHC
jgi:hypothetical protein